MLMYKFAKHTDKELAIIMGQRKKGKRLSFFSLGRFGQMVFLHLESDQEKNCS